MKSFLIGKTEKVAPTVNPTNFGEKDPGDNESHDVTLDPVLRGFPNGIGADSTMSIEYHLTARIVNDSLSRRELSLLLSVLNYQSVTFGVNLNMLLATYELYFKLLGNKSRALEIKDSHLRLTLSVTEVIVHELKGIELSLDAGTLTKLPERVRDLLKRYIMTKRTYGSRYKTYRPEKFISIRAVPVDIQFLTRRKGTEPYSGYTKGYGESHGNAHQSRTSRSAELDGDGGNYLQSDEMFLFTRCTDPIHLLSESLLIRYGNLD